MVRTAKHLQWSSYRATSELQGGLKVDWLFAGFAKRKSLAIKRYIEFVKEEKNHPSPWESLFSQIFLGSNRFIDEVRKHIPNDKDISEFPSSQRRSLAEPISYYCDQAESRNKAIVLAFKSGGYSMRQIGDYLECN